MDWPLSADWTSVCNAVGRICNQPRNRIRVCSSSTNIPRLDIRGRWVPALYGVMPDDDPDYCGVFVDLRQLDYGVVFVWLPRRMNIEELLAAVDVPYPFGWNLHLGGASLPVGLDDCFFPSHRDVLVVSMGIVLLCMAGETLHDLALGTGRRMNGTVMTAMEMMRATNLDAVIEMPPNTGAAHLAVVRTAMAKDIYTLFVMNMLTHFVLKVMVKTVATSGNRYLANTQLTTACWWTPLFLLYHAVGRLRAPSMQKHHARPHGGETSTMFWIPALSSEIPLQKHGGSCWTMLH